MEETTSQGELTV